MPLISSKDNKQKMIKKARIGWSFGDIFIYLIIFIVGSLIVTFLINPNSFNEFKYNIKNLMPESNNQKAVINNNPQGLILNNISNNQIQNTEDSLITKCNVSFSECNDIINQKFGRKYTLIKMQKFESLDGVADVYKTWQTFLVPLGEEQLKAEISAIIPLYCGGDCSNSLPLVLIAIRGTSLDGITGSNVIFCDKSGQLTSYSKNYISC